MEKCTCYAVATDPKRLEMWKRIFPPDGRVPITCPLPVGRAELAGQEADFYLVDLERVTYPQRLTMISELSRKFQVSMDEIRRDIEQRGVPVKAGEVMVAWCPLHSRCVM